MKKSYRIFILWRDLDRQGKIEMTLQNLTENKLQYETFELKLAALLLSEVPHSSFEICENENSPRKTIRIKYPQAYKNQVLKIEKEFINKIASANVYSYNKALNLIRDRLRGRDGRIYQAIPQD